MLKLVNKYLKSLIIRMYSLIVRTRKSRILYYHDLHNDDELGFTEMSTNVSLFQHHLRTIKEKGFEIVTQITHENNQIQLTFDDGFNGIMGHLNLLGEIDFKFSIFIITSRIGLPGYLSVSDLLLIHSKGANIGSHTHSHRNLDMLSKEAVIEEFRSSKETLESILNVEVNEICFPRGRFNRLVLEIAKECGYKVCYCSIPNEDGLNFRDSTLRYRSLSQDLRGIDFICVLNGGLDIFSRRYGRQHFTKF